MNNSTAICCATLLVSSSLALGCKCSRDEAPAGATQPSAKPARSATAAATADETAAGPSDIPRIAQVPSDVSGPPPSATKTPSGLAYRVLQKGGGTRHPTPTDKVRVHYTGWTADGSQFDSSVARGQPTSFPLSGVIKGWTEGVQLMVEGDRFRFWIPAGLAYGERPPAGAPPGMLVFDIELIAIQ